MHAPKLVEKLEDISFGKVQSMHQEVIALPGQLEANLSLKSFRRLLESRIFKNSIEHCAYGVAVAKVAGS
jgi:hypothetical protein